MGQKIFDDKIGTLSHSGGNITMAASPSSPSYLVIGGQQYTITANLVVALPTLAANQRYQVFAVQTAGVVSIVISTNENSIGPVGYNSWKLIGSLYANGNLSVAFGSFVNIEGSPATATPISFTPTGGWSGGNVTYTGRWKRNAGEMMMEFSVALTGAPTGTLLTVNIPSNITIDSANKLSSVYGEGRINKSATNSSGTGQVWGNNSTSISTRYLRLSGIYDFPRVDTTSPHTWGTNDSFDGEAKFPVVSWNSTPIKDL